MVNLGPRHDSRYEGKYYAIGNFMYEHSRIARNQIDAINIRVYQMAGVDNHRLRNALKLLEREARALENNPEAIKEYIKANKLCKEKFGE